MSRFYPRNWRFWRAILASGLLPPRNDSAAAARSVSVQLLMLHMIDQDTDSPCFGGKAPLPGSRD